MKFTDEELSRILSAHEGGQLKRTGSFDWNLLPVPFGCAIQVAKVFPGCGQAFALDRGFCLRFDGAYLRAWSADELLAWLESQGVA